MDYPIILHILSFVHENLHFLVSKNLSKYCVGATVVRGKKLPISLLVEANLFREYGEVISLFRNKICMISARVGNLSALQWLRDPFFRLDQFTIPMEYLDLCCRCRKRAFGHIAVGPKS